MSAENPCFSFVPILQAHDSAAAQTEAEAWEEERMVSKYAEGLEQLPCNRKIPMDPKQVGHCEDRILESTDNVCNLDSSGHERNLRAPPA